MSRSIRSRSFYWRIRAISEAWSADIGVARVVGRRVADADSCRSLVERDVIDMRGDEPVQKARARRRWTKNSFWNCG